MATTKPRRVCFSTASDITIPKPADGQIETPFKEQGGLNLYGFVANNGVDNWDYLGWGWRYVWTGITWVWKWFGPKCGAEGDTLSEQHTDECITKCKCCNNGQYATTDEASTYTRRDHFTCDGYDWILTNQTIESESAKCGTCSGSDCEVISVVYEGMD